MTRNSNVTSSLIKAIVRAFFPALLFTYDEYDKSGKAIRVSGSGSLILVSIVFSLLLFGIFTGIQIFLLLAIALLISKGVYSIPALAGYEIKKGTDSPEDLAGAYFVAKRAAFHWILTVPFIIYIGQLTIEHPSVVLGLMMGAAINFFDCIVLLYKVNLKNDA